MLSVSPSPATSSRRFLIPFLRSSPDAVTINIPILVGSEKVMRTFSRGGSSWITLIKQEMLRLMSEEENNSKLEVSTREDMLRVMEEELTV